MTTTEARAVLHQRLSAALEEALGAKAVWRPAERCPQGHENWPNLAMLGDGIENLPEAEIGEPCVECISTVPFEVHYEHRDEPAWHPEWRIPRGAPVDWDAPAILWPRWARWVEKDNAGYAVWLGYAPAPDNPTWLAFIQFSMAGPADVPLAQADGPSPTAALATAWDALLAREKEVRDGE